MEANFWSSSAFIASAAATLAAGGYSYAYLPYQMRKAYRQSLLFIREAVLLHDIGKVGVNEEILDKVGQLSDEDWATIKQHPARGAEILAEMKFLERIVPWVRGHHERPDGKGYPDGFTTDEITLEAAVIAVADAFDAMTGGPDESSKRVYRAPLTTDQGIDQVRYGAGTQFDPRVVKAFMQVMAREEVTDGS
ncbi:MAG: HD domain-containing protein [Armatimonadetes bacterium]|nr:HD domain-containing protein [Armatimonadota bacterium]